MFSTAAFPAQLPHHSREARGRCLCSSRAEVDSDLGENPVHFPSFWGNNRQDFSWYSEAAVFISWHTVTCTVHLLPDWQFTANFFLCSDRYSALLSYSITACRTGTCISSVVHLSLTSHQLHHHKKLCGMWESLFLNYVLPADCVREWFFHFAHIFF